MTMKYLFLLIFILIYLSGINIGYAQHTPEYTHFVYMFQHTNILHLTLNTFSFISFARMLEKVIPQYFLYGYVYVAAVIASYASIKLHPTIGASGMVFALLGIYITLSICGKKLKIINKSKYLIWLFSIITSAVILAFNPHINNLNHLYAFIIGTIVGIIENSISHKKG